MSAKDEARRRLAQENPRAWIWDEDGSELAGTYVGDDEATTRDGDRVPIRLIETEDGEVRSLWLFESPRLLRENWDECDPSTGDYVITRRYPKRKTQDGERTYWPFAVVAVPGDAPGESEPESTPPPENPGPPVSGFSAPLEDDLPAIRGGGNG